jgi:hypothetical protein
VKSIKKEDVQELGEIKVGFTWARTNGPTQLLEHRASFKAAIEDTLPEKALKGRAISQSAG